MKLVDAASTTIALADRRHRSSSAPWVVIGSSLLAPAPHRSSQIALGELVGRAPAPPEPGPYLMTRVDRP